MSDETTSPSDVTRSDTRLHRDVARLKAIYRFALDQLLLKLTEHKINEIHISRQ